MAIYLQISGINYQVPDRIIIGRGEPFGQFNDNQKVGRAHLRLVRTKKGFYVKDLGTPEGLTVNGKKIKAKKFFLIRPEDRVEFAGETLGVLVTPPTTFICVKKFDSKKGLWSLQNVLYLSLLPFVLLLAIVNYTIGFSPILLIISLGGLGVLYLLLKLISAGIMKAVHLQHLASVTYGKDGFTCHYETGENMTFQYDDITDWSMNFSGYSRILCLEAHGQFHRIQLDKGTKGFEAQLAEKLPVKGSNILQLQVKIGVVLVPLFLLAWYLATQWGAPNLQLVGLGIFISVGIGNLAIVFFPKALDLFIGRMPPSKQRLLAIFSALVILYQAYGLREDAKLVAHTRPLIKECLDGSSSSACHRIDFNALSDITGYYGIEQTELACSKGVESACKYAPSQRIPASIKSSAP
jgi:pSer/pThr/pTyr-binding forkhead associated (FHA) protein